jgi:hypothetical protein
MPRVDQPARRGEGAPHPGADMWRRASALVVPVTDAPRGVEVGRILPVLPGVPEPTRPIVRAPDLDDVTGGAPCPWCSVPNPVDRHYCRRCAMSLAGRPGTTRRPWWRRLLDWRRREIPYAGQRPRLRRGIDRLVRWVVVAGLLSVVGYAVNAQAGTAVMNVEDHFARPVPIFADTVTASHADRDHPVGNLHDSYSNTWWGTGEVGDGAGAYVDAVFGQPVNLLDIVITPGAGVAQDAFTAQSRPETMDVTLIRADGTSTVKRITLADTPGAETFTMRGDDVVRVRFTIVSAYLAGSPGAEVAIAEIEFFIRNAASS